MLLILIFFLTCSFVERLSAWGAEGHRAIGALAQELISSETRFKVQQLLEESGDKDLATASTWADEVRENARLNHSRPKDAEAFNRDFPNNASWHFVDLPLATASMEEAEPFTPGKNDVIHAIERCITVLETGASVSGELRRTQALRLLVHFVGDIHQPLHCGTGFYRLSDTKPPVLVTDPSEALGLPNDRGGNDLFYGPKEELHALWDIGLVAQIADTFDFRSLEAVLKQDYFRPSSPVTSGDYHRWPEVWALESVRLAKDAYFGIRFNNVETMGEREPLWIPITLPGDYEKKNTALAAQQLVRAAVRLAQLLDRLRWP
jgi:S1/P1 Nuclease